MARLLLAFCVVGVAACAGDTETEEPAASGPSPDTLTGSSETASSEVSIFDGDPPAVTLPDLSQLSSSLQSQVETQYAAVEGAAGSEVSAPELGNAYGELGMILMATGLYDSATNAYLNAYRYAPDELRWPYYLGQLARQTGQSRRAADAFERAVSIDATYLPALVYLGEMYLDDSRAPEAEAAFEQALALDPESAAALSGRGRSALAIGEAAQAVEYLERALEVGPRAWDIQYSLANAYRELGQVDRVEALLADRGGDPPQPNDPLMVEYDGLLRSARAFENRGTAAMGEGRYDEAITIFREGLAESPDDAGLHNWLGSALMMTGDTRGAGEEFAEALRLDPEYAQAHLGLGALLAASGRHDDAEEQFRAAIRIQPTYVQARLGLVDALRATGQVDDALDELQQVIDLDPAFVDAWMARAVTLVELGRFREARDTLLQATQVHPDNQAMSDMLVRILVAAPDDAVRDGNRALAIMQRRFSGPVSLDMLESMAMTMAELGRFDEAITWQRQAISAAEQNGMADVAQVMNEALALYEQSRPARELMSAPGR